MPVIAVDRLPLCRLDLHGHETHIRLFRILMPIEDIPLHAFRFICGSLCTSPSIVSRATLPGTLLH